MFLLAVILLGQAPEELPAVTDSSFPLVSAESTAQARNTEVIRYGARRVIYDAEQSLVYLLDSAWVAYQDLQLRSDSIIYDIKRRILSSYKHSRFWSATDSVVGEELHYNTETRKGYMTIASTRLNEGFFFGDNLWLVREKTMDVNRAAYTTCDRHPPHYSFWGRRVRVYLDDMVVVEPLVLRVGRMPVAAAPFWFFPISKHRKSGLLPFRVGRSSDEGFYAKNISWFWAINDYSDATFVLDVMSRKGFRWTGEGTYLVGPYASGQLLASYIREIDTRHTRYSIGGQHNSRFLFGSTITGRADFQSDARYTSDYSEEPQLWLKNELDSYLSLNRVFTGIGTLNLTTRRYAQLQERRTETELPGLRLNLVSIPLGGGWLLNSGFTAGNREQRQDSLSSDSSYIATVRSRRTRSFAPTLSVSLPGSILGGLNIPLGFAYSEERQLRTETLPGSARRDSIAYSRQASTGSGFGFSQTLWGFLKLSEGAGYSQITSFHRESLHTTALYSFSLNSSFSLYRIFALEGMGIHGLLHKVTPNCGYSYSPHSQSRGWYALPVFDTLPRSSKLSFSLANDFEIKLGPAAVKRRLADLTLTTGYELLTRRLDRIAVDLNVILLELDGTDLRLRGDVNLNPDTRKLDGFVLASDFSHAIVTDSQVRGWRQLRTRLSHYISCDRTGSSRHMLTGELQLVPPGWDLKLAGGLNLRERAFTDYRVELVKDLHCWEFLFSLNRLGTRWAYDFKLRIKQLPDVAIGKGLFSWALPAPLR